MSIRINNKIIAGTYTAQSYRYVGEIFQSALPIDDTRVALLDGHKIYDSEGYGSFIQHMHSIIMLYPQLACTEDEWQAINTTYGECGKFVISENNIRLPKIVSFVQGLSSLQDLATLVEAGLPNITGTAQANVYDTFYQAGTGAFKTAQKSGGSAGQGSTAQKNVSINFDASLSNPIYGKSNIVQPQSIRYPYYIVLATGVTQEVKAKEELMTNIPFTLFESKYSEVELNNTSWLLSSGQWNSKELYPSAYNELVKEYNAPTRLHNIVLHTDTYTDYDFVLNLDDETFRLPLKSKLASGKAVGGNGMTLGLTDGTNLCGAVGKNASGSNGNIGSYEVAYGQSVGGYYDGGNVIKANAGIGITTDPTKSGIETSDSDLYLYFYVGETNINTNLVNVGKLTQEVAELKGKTHLVESYTNGTSWYRVYSDGWCEQGGETSISYSHTTNTVALLKPYKNTNYTISLSLGNYVSSGVIQANWQSKTNNNFVIYADYSHETVTASTNWQACGYIT